MYMYMAFTIIILSYYAFQIIILRKFVEQARVHTIKKLSREIVKYRNKKGTDAQKAKNERKSTRLVAEILSIKKVKKDDITKQILTDNLNLQQVLENEISTPLNRAIARIAHHKILSKKISEFKSKYPNYMEFIGPSRKKKAILEWKEKKKMKSKDKAEKMVTKEDNEDVEMLYSEDHQDEIKLSEEANYNKSCTDSEEDNKEENQTKDLIEMKKEIIDEKCKEIDTVRKEKSKLIKENERNKIDNKSEKCYCKENEKRKKNNVSKIINREAIVKRLIDVLEEDNCSKNVEKEINVASTALSVKKEVDSFFMTGDENSYLSIVVPKDNRTSIKNDFHNNKFTKFKQKQFSSQENDKYFSKVVNLKKRDSKLGSRWEEKKLKQNESNGENSKFLKNVRNKTSEFKGVEELHPSWEAKKKQQLMLKTGFAGKKIIFSDDV